MNHKCMNKTGLTFGGKKNKTIQAIGSGMILLPTIYSESCAYSMYLCMHVHECAILQHFLFSSVGEPFRLYYNDQLDLPSANVPSD